MTLAFITPSSSNYVKPEKSTAISITFETGILGFSQYTHFKLVELDDGSYPPLKLLVSSENPSLSFILYPHKNDTSLYNDQSWHGIHEAHGLDDETTTIYTLVTIRRDQNHFHLTTNLQTPLIFNLKTNQGFQHISSEDGLPSALVLDRFSPELPL